MTRSQMRTSTKTAKVTKRQVHGKAAIDATDASEWLRRYFLL